MNKKRKLSKTNKPSQPSRRSKRLPSKPKGATKRAEVSRQKTKHLTEAEIRRLGDGDFTRGVIRLCGGNDVAASRHAVKQYASRIDRRAFLVEGVLHLRHHDEVAIAVEFLGDVNAEIEGANPICQAIGADNDAFIAALIKAGADLCVVESKFGRSALHYAAEIGSPKMVKACLAAGADVNAPDRDGRSPLWLLCASEWCVDESDWAESARLLIDAGATVDAEGELMLECVKSVGKVAVMELLAANGQSLADSQAEELGDEVGQLFSYLAAQPETIEEELGIEKLEFLVGQLGKLVVKA